MEASNLHFKWKCFPFKTCGGIVEAHTPQTLCQRLPRDAHNPNTLTCDLLYRYGDDVGTTSGCSPSLLAFSLNMLRGFSMQIPITHADICPPVTHPSRPCVYVNQQHLRRKGIFSELFSHRGLIFRAEFFFDYSRCCKLVFNLACTFFFFKSELTFSNLKIDGNIWIFGYSWKLQMSINLGPLSHGKAQWQLPSGEGAGRLYFKFCITHRSPYCLLISRFLCPLPFVTELPWLFLS